MENPLNIGFVGCFEKMDPIVFCNCFEIGYVSLKHPVHCQEHTHQLHLFALNRDIRHW